jgi:hypothetical protein
MLHHFHGSLYVEPRSACGLEAVEVLGGLWSMQSACNGGLVHGSLFRVETWDFQGIVRFMGWMEQGIRMVNSDVALPSVRECFI